MAVHGALGILGCGRIGRALACAWQGARIPYTIYASHRRKREMDQLVGIRQLYGRTANAEIVRRCDTVILCVRPDQVQSVVYDIASEVHRSQVIISVACGITCRQIRQWGAPWWRVVQVIPSSLILLPGSVGTATHVFGEEMAADANTIDVARGLFEAIGQVLVIPEEHVNVYAALCSCTPAFLLTLFDQIAAVFSGHGVPREQALSILAGQAVVLGQALAGGALLNKLCRQIATPGGATQAGLDVLDDQGRQMWADCLSAALSHCRKLNQMTHGEP